jgi:hypothetical protein
VRNLLRSRATVVSILLLSPLTDIHIHFGVYDYANYVCKHATHTIALPSQLSALSEKHRTFLSGKSGCIKR